METNWLTFTGIAALLTITPGADTVLVIKNTIACGKREALFTAFGICGGLFVHAIASTVGLSVIFAQSAEAYNLVRILGAGYLIYLGGRSLWRAYRGSDTAGIEELKNPAGAARGRSAGGRFIEGLLCNVLNPKVAVFYLTFLPQFIDPAAGAVALQGVALAGIHVLQGVVWLAICAYSVNRMRAVMTRPTIRRRIEALSGAVLMAFGAKLALERS